MNTLLISTFTFLFLSSTLIAEDLNPEDIEYLEQNAKERGTLRVGGFTDGIVYDESDFETPAKGKILEANIKIINKVVSENLNKLSAVPDTLIGKKSVWYPKFVHLNTSLKSAAETKSDNDLVKLIPSLLLLVERDRNSPKLCDEIEVIHGNFTNIGFVFISAIAHRIANYADPFENQVHNAVIAFFSNYQLIDETCWEDEPMPVDSAGILILNPGLAVEELKKRPVERVRFFMRGSLEAGEFFRRYEADGDGLAVLKARLAANRAEVEAKHREIQAWLASK